LIHNPLILNPKTSPPVFMPAPFIIAPLQEFVTLLGV
jgi:hypothetical protein